MLVIPDELHDRWNELGLPAQRHVRTYLAGTGRPARVVMLAVGDQLPAPFATDVVAGGSLLRAAFPALERRIAAIDVGPRMQIEIACEGRHEGAFYAILAPTGRRAAFREVHELTLRGNRVVSDLVTIDYVAIIRQLAVTA